MRRGQIFIGGNWLNGKTVFESINPANEGIIGKAIQTSPSQIKQAVAAARISLPDWQARGVHYRADVLKRVAEVIDARIGKKGEETPLKELICDEVGKPFTESESELFEAADAIRFFADEGPKVLLNESLPLDVGTWPSKQSHIVRDPVGVVAVIKPWNYPFQIPFWALGAALIAGNTVVFKPSKLTPFVGLEIGKILQEASVPNGVINVVTGDDKVGERLVRNPEVDMVSFTGSVQVGQRIASICGRQLKKYSLELGGKDPAIVCDDADIELTTKGLVWGAFNNAGQVCTSIERVYVDKSLSQRLIDELIRETMKLRIGIEISPLVSRKQLSKVERQVSEAIQLGARVIIGGARPPVTKGYYYLPTILTVVSETMSIMHEETFGPVLPIVVVDNYQEAIKCSNSSRYALGASVWTKDKTKALKIAEQLDAGMVWINDVNLTFPQCPWVGRKDSGTGIGLSKYGIQEFTRIKHISTELGTLNTREWWYPY